MKLSELMQGYTPKSDFTGFITNDDWVLAVDISDGKNAAKGDYVIVQEGVSGVDSQMNPVTMDKQYIRAGQSTTKTGTQRAFTLSGDRYIGDDFQDWAFSTKIKYGTGEAVNVPYIYFNLKNGVGEQGKVAVIVNSDAGGNAGDNSTISIDLKKSGAQPTEYVYNVTYTVTSEEPADWETNYTDYYTRTGASSNYVYTPVQKSDSAPVWTSDTYYKGVIE